MNILSPSILAADFSKLGEEIQAVEKGGAQYIHFDVMDGVYVPSISFGMPVLRCVRKITDRVLDVHLMITEPDKYIEEFASCGADIITVHLETLKYPEHTIELIRKQNCKVGIAINPETSLHAVVPYLELVDMVLVMSVRPGFGGQKYLDYCTDKIKRLSEIIHEKKLHIDLEVDGGICDDNLQTVLEAGANVIVMGSSIFRGDALQNTEHYIKILQA